MTDQQMYTEIWKAWAMAIAIIVVCLCICVARWAVVAHQEDAKVDSVRALLGCQKVMVQR